MQSVPNNASSEALAQDNKRLKEELVHASISLQHANESIKTLKETQEKVEMDNRKGKEQSQMDLEKESQRCKDLEVELEQMKEQVRLRDDKDEERVKILQELERERSTKETMEEDIETLKEQLKVRSLRIIKQRMFKN